MDHIIETFKNTGALHHAYLIEGDREQTLLALLPFLEQELEIAIRGNPDFWHGKYETMGIEDARSLSMMQQNRSLSGGRKIFVVSSNSLTHEAQNSLLKVLEEPTEGTHFFFLMPSAERLLPTLASRLQIVRFEGIGLSLKHDIDKFINGTPTVRMEFLKNILEEKDKSAALVFVTELERAIRAKINLPRASLEEIVSLTEVEKGRQYLLDRSSSIKLILEHISLIIPRFK